MGGEGACGAVAAAVPQEGGGRGGGGSSTSLPPPVTGRWDEPEPRGKEGGRRRDMALCGQHCQLLAGQCQLLRCLPRLFPKPCLLSHI